MDIARTEACCDRTRLLCSLWAGETQLRQHIPQEINENSAHRRDNKRTSAQTNRGKVKRQFVESNGANLGLLQQRNSSFIKNIQVNVVSGLTLTVRPRRWAEAVYIAAQLMW